MRILYLLPIILIVGCTTPTAQVNGQESQRKVESSSRSIPQIITYSMQITHPNATSIHLTVQAPCLRNKPPVFVIKKDYAALKGFDRFIANVHASIGDKTVPVIRAAMNRWEVTIKECRSIKLDYDVLLQHRQEFSSPDHPPGSNELPFVDQSHGFFLGQLIFLYPEPHSDLPITLRLNAPPQWKPVGPWPYRDGRFMAGKDLGSFLSNYFAVGTFQTSVEKIGGMQIMIAAAPGEKTVIENRLMNTLTLLLRTSRNFFQRSPRPAFLVVINPWELDGFGGSVRRDSIVLNMPLAVTADRLIDMAQLVTHEFMHTWNCGEPQDENQLRWFNEGFNDYLSWLVLREAHIIDWIQWTKRMQTLFESARDASQASGNPSLINASKQFMTQRSSRQFTYSAGAILAFSLDQRLQQTAGKKTLLGFMQYFFNGWCMKQSSYSLDNIFAEAEKYGGVDFVQAWKNQVERQGFPAPEDLTVGEKCRWINHHVKTPRLGIGWHSQGGKAYVDEVGRDSPAAKSGMQPQDRILKINDARITGKKSFDQALRSGSAPLSVEIERQGAAIKLMITPKYVDEIVQELQCKR